MAMNASATEANTQTRQEPRAPTCSKRDRTDAQEGRQEGLQQGESLVLLCLLRLKFG